MKKLKLRISDFVWYWRESFKFMSPRSKLWVLLHGWPGCKQFMRRFKV